MNYQLQQFWNHRCYVIGAKGEGWQARNVFPDFMIDIPRSFMWTAREDKDGMREYIDALLLGQTSKALFYETNGLVVESVPFHTDHPENQAITINVKRLADFLLLRDSFDVPLWGRMNFVTDGARVVPTTFIAAMAQIIDPKGKFITPDRTWRHCSERDLATMGLSPEDVTTSLYHEESDTAVDQAREVELERIVNDRHIDLLTQVLPSNGKPYYARRIFLLQDGHCLWEGTAFSPAGPWKVWKRDSALILAGKIVEPASL